MVSHVGICGRQSRLRLAVHMRSRLESRGGFTLVELLVVILISSVLLAVGLLFLRGTSTVFNSQQVRILNQDDARTAINQLTRYLRMATNSASNNTSLSNALATTLGTDIEFYCDADGDGIAEKLRYYLEGSVLRTQSEDPVWVVGTNPYWQYGAYDTDGVVIENRVRNASGEPMFVYYRQGATGLEEFAPVTDAGRREVVTVGILVRVGERPDLAARDVFLSTEVQIRQRYNGGLNL
jgi:prepilin-type N-terminal cleavage/methylation domain-containing protein